MYDLDGIPAIAGCDLDTPAGVPGFERMSMEAVADDLLTTFLARRIQFPVAGIYLPVRPIFFPVRTHREFALGCGRISIT
ncbi:MAG TPA: hypothetical protein VHY78_03735 [Stellaceae bacterium]|nr:hypothetical protein [Stellaceae bacterium]